MKHSRCYFISPTKAVANVLFAPLGALYVASTVLDPEYALNRPLRMNEGQVQASELGYKSTSFTQGPPLGVGEAAGKEQNGRAAALTATDWHLQMATAAASPN